MSCFNYETINEKAIKNISLEIKGNTMTAFVGHSGAGKVLSLTFTKIL